MHGVHFVFEIVGRACPPTVCIRFVDRFKYVTKNCFLVLQSPWTTFATFVVQHSNNVCCYNVVNAWIIRVQILALDPPHLPKPSYTSLKTKVNGGSRKHPLNIWAISQAFVFLALFLNLIHYFFLTLCQRAFKNGNILEEH